MFTRIAVTKLMSLKEAIKESKKVKTEIEEKPLSPLELKIPLEMAEKILQDLYLKVRQNPGNRELKIRITSKLKDVIIESSLKVNNNFVEVIDGDKYIDIVA
jgi:DNA polymerase-3 subunit alpha